MDKLIIAGKEFNSRLLIGTGKFASCELMTEAIELAAAAFGQRRKMVRRSLTGVFADPDGALRAAGIDPTSRAEVLSVDDYLALAGVAT